MEGGRLNTNNGLVVAISFTRIKCIALQIVLDSLAKRLLAVPKHDVLACREMSQRCVGQTLEPGFPVRETGVTQGKDKRRDRLWGQKGRRKPPQLRDRLSAESCSMMEAIYHNGQTRRLFLSRPMIKSNDRSPSQMRAGRRKLRSDRVRWNRSGSEVKSNLVPSDEEKQLSELSRIVVP